MHEFAVASSQPYRPQRILFSILAVVCAVLVAGDALADCAFPQPPASIPNGASATREEMVAAAAAFRTYNESVTAYQACLEKDTADRTASASGATAAEEIRQLKTMQRRKHNESQKTLEEKVSEFNEQLKIFKARG
jgi:urease alpha subunit